MNIAEEIKTLKVYINKCTNSTIYKGKIVNYKGSNHTLLYIPIWLTIFSIGEELTINRTIDGFTIRKATIDDNRRIKFNSSRALLLKSNVYEDIEGDYEYEIIDTDTLKIIKV